MRARLDSWKYQDKWFWIRRCTAMVVVIAMVATCVQSAIVKKNTDVVQAAEEGQKIISLSAIEELKESVKASDEQTFIIVEVVPAIGTGTMGYWVPGEEPLNYYEDGQVVSFVEQSQINQKTSKVDREEAALTVTSKLNSLGLLEVGDSCALMSAPYAEYIPGIAKEIPVEAVRIPLVNANGESRTEEVKLDSGAFEYKANKTGNFDMQSSNVQFVADGTGAYKQEVDYFVYGEAGSGVSDAFYYQPTFERIDFSDLDDDENINSEKYAGKAIYEKKGDRYDYLGTLGVNDFNLEIQDNMEYYWVTNVGNPSDNDDGTDGTYLAVGGFAPVSDDEAGYFTADTSYTYVGENQGSYSYNPDVMGTVDVIVTYSELYVNIGFTNNNWFRQHVLDDDTAKFMDEFKIQVEEVLPSELTSEKIDDADLLVFAAGFSLSATNKNDTLVSLYSETNDVKSAIRNEIVNSVKNGAYKKMTTPIMMDGNLHGKVGTTDELKKIVNQCAQAIVGDKTYEHIDQYGGAEGGLYYIAQGDALVTRNIIAEIAKEAIYYSEVSATIAYENFLRLTTNVDQIEGTAAQINIATSIRHILMVGNQIKETQKTEIRVLEIQPANSASTKYGDSDEDIVTNDKLMDWFSGVNGNTTINIDQMSTAEFIGKIDDITEIYDVIYIGADFGNLNISGSNASKTVNYNDDAMDGLFYTNIGDTYKASNYTFTGLLNSDYAMSSSNEPVLVKDTNGSFYALDKNIDTTYRFSGNDISTVKLEELNTFVKTGLPVIISDSLVSGNSIRKDRVDKASYMYDFLSKAIEKANVFTASQAEDNSATANQYLNLSKPAIVFETDTNGNITGIPTEYKGETNLGTSLVDNQTVSYTFTITNDTDPTPEDTAYSVGLYIDQDADGRHEANEKISELEVKDSNGNLVAENALKAGVKYTVNKVLPDTYKGSIPWKLEVSIVGREEFHTSQTGYTYIKPDSRIEINILQIHETNKNIITQNTYYKKYIKEMYDNGVYDVNITGITITNLNNNTNSLSYVDDSGKLQTKSGDYTSSDIYENCLKRYDMLVLGFGDGYGKKYDNGGLNAEAAEAVAEFIDSGKAVLFAHDTTSTNNVPALPNDNTYPMVNNGVDAGGMVELTGETIMTWVTAPADLQHSEVVGEIAWSMRKGEYDDVTQGVYSPSYTTINRLDNEVYNYEEGKWGWWKAPEGDQYVVTPYDEYTAIEDANAFYGTELPYWNALLSGGTWGYYGYTAGGKVWQTASYQPPEDVCYIYRNNQWGWYQIREVVPGETTTTDGEMVWEKYQYSDNYEYNYIIGKKKDNKKGTWKYVNTTGGEQSFGNFPQNNMIYNYEKKEWGWWKAPEDSEIEKVNYDGTVNGNNSSSYKIDPYWNGANWGVKSATVEGYWYYYVTYSFTNYQSQPADNVFYIYENNAWGWYQIEGETVPLTKVPDKNQYIYEVQSEADYTVYEYSVTWPTSYYFNTILRDSIGLDRYGITNPDYNTNYMYPYNMEENSNGQSVLVKDEALVANGYQYQYDDATEGITVGDEITTDDKQALLDAGYSIAYKPTKDNTWEYVEETQGYATGDMVGRGVSGQLAPVKNSYKFSNRVSSVSQVNKGQITSYPYNVNTNEFDDASSYGQFFSVAETHHQYYQLNMNSEDLVVWYCLAGDIYADYPNDASNFYYIYNSGNVTYTGAGHSGEKDAAISVGQEEAKLFINTMIAAYRAGRVAPKVAIVDSDGMILESVYFTTEQGSETSQNKDTLLVQSGVAGLEDRVPFRITDSNLENPDKREIHLVYENSIGEEIEIDEDDILIYNSDDVIVANGELLGNTPYTLKIPKEILDELADTEVTKLTIGISVTTVFADKEKWTSNTADIDLYKLALQQLN